MFYIWHLEVADLVQSAGDFFGPDTETAAGMEKTPSEVVSMPSALPTDLPIPYETLKPYLDNYIDQTKVLIVHHDELTDQVTKVKFIDRQGLFAEFGSRRE